MRFDPLIFCSGGVASGQIVSYSSPICGFAFVSLSFIEILKKASDRLFLTSIPAGEIHCSVGHLSDNGKRFRYFLCFQDLSTEYRNILRQKNDTMYAEIGDKQLVSQNSTWGRPRFYFLNRKEDRRTL